MDEKKKSSVISRIEEQIAKIDNKDFTLFFYVVDTKGNPSGSLAYIYDIALSLKYMGYNVAMMHSEEEFVGVGEWLGKEYADLPHYNVEKKSIDVTPSDFLFIPEVYSNVMNATKKLPCQRIAILQSFEKLTEFIPFGATWGDLKITKAITTTEENAQRLKKYFPYVNVQVINPKIASTFVNSSNIKQLMVNVVTRDVSDVNKIVKTFFWEYPMYQWVAFRDLRGLSREEFGQALNDAAITVWVDNNTDFGYVPLEAMKCGSIVVGKAPNEIPEWMLNKEGELTHAGIWVENLSRMPTILASVIRTWTMDGIPEDLFTDAQELVERYNEKQQLEDIKNVIVDGFIQSRKQEYLDTLNTLNNSENND